MEGLCECESIVYQRVTVSPKDADVPIKTTPRRQSQKYPSPRDVDMISRARPIKSRIIFAMILPINDVCSRKNKCTTKVWK